MSDHNGWQQKLSDDARRFQDLHDRVSRMSVTETSRDGLIKVTVSSSGALTELEMPGSLAGVAAGVLECVRRAQSRIPALLQETAAQTVGADDVGVRLLVDDAGKRFPEPDPPPTASRREPRGDDDEDWDGPEVMDDGR
ncbi:YbaB/EbfC family nucleoid-associated protein [Umezawaea endophytica]|uniref:YbaB/EbfC family nucleoid-associated protein n=1 Tax=Umezawaea endophytica TaxID=1654476 RepID=A0A9X3AFP9_9PSEU|nr:YbaB/EbfC family nucleoid-associated protein [Umezawaea endophytica]MCS7478591.1 YbaB/EbfC family nucleoid-associated protein [Umezawaea endophytica]